MKKLLTFAFMGNISEKLLVKLGKENSEVLDSSESAIEAFIDRIIVDKPEYILGLGEYSGRDREKIRLETICTNKFRNKVLGARFEQIPLSSFITSNNFKVSSKIGNSYCNLVSYKIMKLVSDKKLVTQYSFLHIPKNFNLDQAINEVQDCIE